MKKLGYGLLTFTVLMITNCSSVKNDIGNSASGTKEKNFVLVAENSSLEWEGRWIGGQNDGKSHNGTVNIASGTLTQTGKDLTGTFTVDMNTIKCTDMTNKEGNNSLIEDLKSEYFFKVAEFPKVAVNFKKIIADSALVTATVLGIPITQTLPIKVTMDGKIMTLKGNFAFDLKEAKVQELFVNPLEEEMGGLSSKVLFNLNVELINKTPDLSSNTLE